MASKDSTVFMKITYSANSILMIGFLGLTAEEVKGYDSFSTAPWLYSDKMYIVMKNLAKLSVIMLYIFLADR